MSGQDIDPRDVAGLTRKLNALKAQLPDRERRLLSSVIAAAAAAGVLTPVVEAPDTTLATVEAAVRAAATEGTASVQEQFASAFAPGTRDLTAALSIKLPPSEQ
jgi:hypothetical protein